VAVKEVGDFGHVLLDGRIDLPSTKAQRLRGTNGNAKPGNEPSPMPSMTNAQNLMPNEGDVFTASS
jgi:hypothetical protein